MKQYFMVFLASISMAIAPVAEAKRGGKSKRSYVGIGSYSTSDHEETRSSQLYFEPPIQSSTIIKKAGVRTCANKHCTVITHYPKGKTIQWAIKKDGFINVLDTPYWIMATDVK